MTSTEIPSAIEAAEDRPTAPSPQPDREYERGRVFVDQTLRANHEGKTTAEVIEEDRRAAALVDPNRPAAIDGLLTREEKLRRELDAIETAKKDAASVVLKHDELMAIVSNTTAALGRFDDNAALLASGVAAGESNLTSQLASEGALPVLKFIGDASAVVVQRFVAERAEAWRVELVKAVESAESNLAAFRKQHKISVE
jgi:hypothetical protein